MIIDALPFADIWRRMHSKQASQFAQAFIAFLEKKIGGSFVYNGGKIPYGNADLVDLFELAEKMRSSGTLLSYSPAAALTDEPPIPYWTVRFRDTAEENMAGGSDSNERDALTKALAESVERHIWFERDDYFRGLHRDSIEHIARRGDFLTPLRFAGLDPDHPSRTIHLRDGVYSWLRGTTLDGKNIWIPGQSVTVHQSVRKFTKHGEEPEIRNMVTTGLATHPDRTQALLSGALEIIERDAYMIMWLNQLSLPRLSIDDISEEYPHLAALVAQCRRYRLEPHVIRMITDAPTYAITVILEDASDHAPRYALGIKAHRNLASAIEGALLESLRTRRAVRRFVDQKIAGANEARNIGHYDRHAYWAQGERSKRLAFLIQGKKVPIPHENWESLSVPEHLARIGAWCNAESYAFASVPFTHSRANVTPWHIEMVIIPELQPLYYWEDRPHTFGARIAAIPKKFGYTPRSTPYTDDPHPFA